ncbi:DUF2855 family protein [Streptomyces sp. MS1.AVA.1]|uniref:DUF2855 family protein n=1 Tax=Streptomyces machairae TaxID=3134109 RepID=A0ABU8UVT9_9ACTN
MDNTSAATAWNLLVRRDDLSTAELEDAPVPQVHNGEALLRVDRVGLTANNVTYAALGDSFRYWEFFPSPRAGWGIVPSGASPTSSPPGSTALRPAAATTATSRPQATCWSAPTESTHAASARPVLTACRCPGPTTPTPSPRATSPTRPAARTFTSCTARCSGPRSCWPTGSSTTPG